MSTSRTRPAIGVTICDKLTHTVIKTQVYLREEELDALRAAAERTGSSVAEMVRQAIREVWLRPASDGPVAIWGGLPGKTSMEHDSIYDEH